MNRSTGSVQYSSEQEFIPGFLVEIPDVEGGEDFLAIM